MHAVHQVWHAFFNPYSFTKAMPDIWAGFQINLRIMVIAEALVLVLALGLAIVRGLPGPAAKPLRALAIVYTDFFRGTPLILVAYVIALGIPSLKLAVISYQSLFVYGIVSLTLVYTAYVTGVRCCIPEYKVDLKHLIDLLLQDKRNNPSNYSLAILSEGAEWQGYTVREYGEADAFGHRKKMSVAEDLSDEIKRATGEETVVSDLTYDLRSGSPDFVDRLVAFTFAGMAMDALQEGNSGLMTAINEGRYAMVTIPDPKLGPRKVDIGSMYNIDRYRPKYDHKLGLPIFLTRPQ